MPDAVRALNTILAQLAGKEAVAAHKAGDSLARVDVALWGPAWEGARNFRDHWVLVLARQTRDQWRQDVAEIIKEQPEFNRARMIEKAMDVRLQITLDFAFKFLTRRHVCFLADALMLAFESDVPPGEMAKVLAGSAARSKHANQAILDALVLGASQMFRYSPERVLSSGRVGGGFKG